MGSISSREEEFKSAIELEKKWKSSESFRVSLWSLVRTRENLRTLIMCAVRMRINNEVVHVLRRACVRVFGGQSCKDDKNCLECTPLIHDYY